MTEKTQIIVVGSGKGGCGKTVTSMALLDYLLSCGTPPHLVETDTTNPDVAKAYKNSVETELINLDIEDGWIVFLNLCERLALRERTAQTQARRIIVNTGSRNSEALKRFGALLADSIEALQLDLVTLWLIDGNRDVLELLHEYLEIFPSARVHVLRNQHCATSFELYDQGNVRKLVEARGGASLTLPALSWRVMQTVNRDRLTFAAAADSAELPFGHKQALAKWRRDVRPLCEQVVQRSVATVDAGSSAGA